MHMTPHDNDYACRPDSEIYPARERLKRTRLGGPDGFRKASPTTALIRLVNVNQYSILTLYGTVCITERVCVGLVHYILERATPPKMLGCVMVRVLSRVLRMSLDVPPTSRLRLRKLT